MPGVKGFALRPLTPGPIIGDPWYCCTAMPGIDTLSLQILLKPS